MQKFTNLAVTLTLASAVSVEHGGHDDVDIPVIIPEVPDKPEYDPFDGCVLPHGASIQHIFFSADLDRDGYIACFGELPRIWEYYHCGEEHFLSYSKCHKFDEDKDGHLDLHEFYHLFTYDRPAPDYPDNSTCGRMFHYEDRDHDGYLEENEMKNFLAYKRFGYSHFTWDLLSRLIIGLSWYCDEDEDGKWVWSEAECVCNILVPDKKSYH